MILCSEAEQIYIKQKIMRSNTKNRKQIVKKKNIAWTNFLQRLTSPFQNPHRVHDIAAGEYYQKNGFFDISQIGVQAIRDRTRRIQHMSKGFFKTAIWNPDEKREDLHQSQGPNIEIQRKRGLGFLHNRQIQGNDIKGKEWVQLQQKKQRFEFSEEQSLTPLTLEEKKVILIETSDLQAKKMQLKKMGIKFQDCDFTPTSSSLLGQSDPFNTTIVWDRASDKMSNPCIFQQKITPRDIRQGLLGDSYFLAGLAALAERPDRISELFLHNNIQSGIYSVRIIFKGKWHEVILDEYIPYSQNAQIPSFSHSKKNSEMWVMLLEKAWAKTYGNYRLIEAGHPEQVLHELTGAPTKNIYLNHPTTDLQNEWNYLVESSLREYAMIASSRPGSDTHTNSFGSVQGYAYTFLNAGYVGVKSGSQVHQERIVQLRDPWGNGLSYGKWAKDDYTWNLVDQAEKQKLGFNPTVQDGIFYMSYEAFCKVFSILTVAQINDNASYIYESWKDPNCTGAYFTIDILKKGTYSLQTDKTSERSANVERGFTYPVGEIGLRRIDTNSYQLYQGLLSRKRYMFRKYELDVGRYVAFVKINFNPKHQKDYEVTLAVYSEYACQIRISTHQQAQSYERKHEVLWNPVGIQTKKNPRLNHLQHPQQQKQEDTSIRLHNETIQHVQRSQHANTIEVCTELVHFEQQNLKKQTEIHEQQKFNQRKVEGNKQNAYKIERQQEVEQQQEIEHAKIEREQSWEYDNITTKHNRQEEHYVEETEEAAQILQSHEVIEHEEFKESEEELESKEEIEQEHSQNHHQHHGPSYFAPELIGDIENESQEQKQQEKEQTSMVNQNHKEQNVHIGEVIETRECLERHQSNENIQKQYIRIDETEREVQLDHFKGEVEESRSIPEGESQYVVTEHKVITTTKTKSKKTRTIIDSDGNEHVQVLEDKEENNQKVEFLDIQNQEGENKKLAMARSCKSEENIDSMCDEAPIEEIEDQMRLIDDVDDDEKLRENIVEKAESSPGDNSPEQSQLVPQHQLRKERVRTQDFRSQRRQFNFSEEQPIEEVHNDLEESQPIPQIEESYHIKHRHRKIEETERFNNSQQCQQYKRDDSRQI